MDLLQRTEQRLACVAAEGLCGNERYGRKANCKVKLLAIFHRDKGGKAQPESQSLNAGRYLYTARSLHQVYALRWQHIIRVPSGTSMFLNAGRGLLLNMIWQAF